MKINLLLMLLFAFSNCSYSDENTNAIILSTVPDSVVVPAYHANWLSNDTVLTALSMLNIDDQYKFIASVFKVEMISMAHILSGESQSIPNTIGAIIEYFWSDTADYKITDHLKNHGKNRLLDYKDELNKTSIGRKLYTNISNHLDTTYLKKK